MSIDARQSDQRSRPALYAELTKARLSLLVLVTAAVGYVMGLPTGVNLIDAGTSLFAAVRAGDWAAAGEIVRFALTAIDWGELCVLLIGVGLAAGGTSAVNQWMEHDRDAAMQRTVDRPLPSGRMSRGEALLAGTGMIFAGFALVMLFVNPLAALLTMLTAALYIAVYTPLKLKTSLNTLVGAVCGAIPPMIGWAAASGTVPIGAWVLGAILFVWQLPHFLALAWMYRDDYARGGFRMLPVFDSDGRLTGHITLITALMLVPLTLMAVLFEMTGTAFAFAAAPLGLLFAWTALSMVREPTRRRARAVFLASIAYLPLVLGAMVIDQARPRVHASILMQNLQEHNSAGGAEIRLAAGTDQPE